MNLRRFPVNLFYLCFGLVLSEKTWEPTISENSITKNVNVTLSCYGQSIPPMVVFIQVPRSFGKEDGNAKKSSEYSYLNFSTKLNGTGSNGTTYKGVYSCIAENGVGKDRYQDMPRESLKKASLGSDVELECYFLANPTPELFFSKSGVPLLNNSDYEIQKFQLGPNIFLIKLIIKNIEENHFRSYGCHAKNQLGTVKSSVTLNEVNPLARVPVTLTPLKSAASELSILYCIMLVFPLMHVPVHV